MQQGKNDEALALLESIAAAEPTRRGVLRQIGIANYRKGDFLKAAANFKKALDEDPADNEAVQLMGLSYYLAGRPAEAIAPLEKVQAWFPSANVDAAYILGVCYMQTKDYPNARKAFARMFGVPGDSAAAYLFTARMLLRQDFAPVAEEYAKKAVELDPKLPRAQRAARGRRAAPRSQRRSASATGRRPLRRRGRRTDHSSFASGFPSGTTSKTTPFECSNRRPTDGHCQWT